MAYNDILCLNVGGTRFETTRQTLLKDPESMLARMFQPDSQLAPAQIKDGAYFLDRSPAMFGILLDFLRSNYLEVMPQKDMLKLQVEAEYFQIKNLQEIINQRLENNEIQFLIRELKPTCQESHHMSALRVWFKGIPIPVLAQVLNMKIENFNLSEINDKAECSSADSCVVDADGNICVYNEEPNKIFAAMFELKTQTYQSHLSKAIIYLRDYYFADQSEIEIKIGGELVFKCKKCVLIHGTVRMIAENGDIAVRRTLKICSRERNGCGCNSPHGTTLKNLVTRILDKLERNRVGEVEPASGTELWEDSYAAKVMWLLSDNKWFTE